MIRLVWALIYRALNVRPVVDVELELDKLEACIAGWLGNSQVCAHRENTTSPDPTDVTRAA